MRFIYLGIIKLLEVSESNYLVWMASEITELSIQRLSSEKNISFEEAKRIVLEVINESIK